MVDGSEARTFPDGAAKIAIVDATNVDQQVEEKLGTIAKRGKRFDHLVGSDDDRHFTERDRRALDLVAKRARKRRAERVRNACHQRAIVLVRQILFWSCTMP